MPVEADRSSSVPEKLFEPAVFVSGKSQCSDFRIDCANRFQILIADIGEDDPSDLRDFCEFKRPAHELVVIYSLSNRSDARPGRKIVGVALAMIKCISGNSI